MFFYMSSLTCLSAFGGIRDPLDSWIPCQARNDKINKYPLLVSATYQICHSCPVSDTG